jgi:hypothetical protein
MPQRDDKIRFGSCCLCFQLNSERWIELFCGRPCPDKTTALPLPEYEINKEIFECAKTQVTGEFCTSAESPV